MQLGPYFMPQFDLIDPLSLSHLVPEILGPKLGLMFHQNVLFKRVFKYFASIFSLIFDPIDRLFHWF